MRNREYASSNKIPTHTFPKRYDNNKIIAKSVRNKYTRRNTIIILIAELGALFYFNWSHQLLFAKSILAAILLVGLAQWFALLQKKF